MNFTDEEKTVLLDAIDQDVEKWRFEDGREVSNTAEADMIGGAV